MEMPMMAVIFELWPAEGRAGDYFALASALRSDLEKIDGFVSIERFESLVTPGKVLSLSFWRDEEAIRRWRNLEDHRAAQAKGRGGIFADYRLRVASVVRDYGFKERGEAPGDSRAVHDPRGSSGRLSPPGRARARERRERAAARKDR
jgi:heme-degrading monooxygenase HmoA